MGSGAISQPMYDLLLGAAKATGRIDDPVVRDELMKVYAMETTKSLVAMRTRAELKAGKAPGPGGSLGKLYSSLISWRFREIAMEIARLEGIELTDRHFEVLEFMRKDFAEQGAAPSIRRLKKLGIVPTKELYTLFPGGPAKKASKIAGLPKPKGCV